MNFSINNAYLECLDVNYDDLYLNRYIDSIYVLNYIDFKGNNEQSKLYFNFIDVFNNDLTKANIKYIQENIFNNDIKLHELIDFLNLRFPHILYNNKILFFRNINNFVSNTSKLFQLEEYIESVHPHSYLILRSETDLSAMGYTELFTNHYIKKLY